MTDLNPDTAPDVTDPAPAAPAAAEKKDVKVAAAKGRPMLSWVGKRPLSSVAAYPAQLMERYDVCPAPPSTPFLDREGSALAPGLGSEGSGEAAPCSLRLPRYWEWGVSPFSDWPAAYPQGGLLFHGDNKEVLGHLLANGFRGKVNLVYIDPPFDSGADYVRKVSLRGLASKDKLSAEGYTLPEQTQYTDIWAKDNYLQFMYERLLLVKELLAENGSLFLHLDSGKVHYLKVLLDEVFGEDNFRNEIIWRSTNSHNSATTQLGPIHQTILFYSKNKSFELHPGKRPFSAGYIRERFKYTDARGIYQPNYLTGPGLRAGDSGKAWGGFNPSSKGRHWAIPAAIKELLPDGGEGLSTFELLDKLREADVLLFPKKDGGQPMYKQYITGGVAYQDLWCYQPNTQGVLYESDECIDEDVKYLEQEGELANYPTQKPEGLLARVLQMSSKPSDLVLDCFIGSGTTAAVAQKLGRRWIGCDINKGAIQTTAKRLHTIMEAQCKAQDAPAKAGRNGSRKGKADAAKQEMAEMAPVPAEGGEADPTAEDVPATARPAQTSFSSWRVNDYDLQIQHNEAVELACELIGVERNRTDGFFDGKRGGSLVKIIPFNHALTPLDIEEVALELRARPEEMRPILLVCLGQEIAAQARVEEWNRLLKKDSPNYLEVIELRSDPKYGGVFQHAPDEARVTSQAEGDKLIVEITDFVSPTIQERLNKTAGILQPVIDDWRAMVDCVLIDTDYHAPVFQVAHADIPEKKTDLVHGRYELPMPPPGATIAVKIIDMLGEEVLKTLHAPSRT